MRRSTLKDPSKETWDIIILAGQSNAGGSGFGPASKAWYPDDRVYYLEPDMTLVPATERVNGGQDPVECIHFSREALYQLGHRYFRMFQTLR